MTNLKSKSGIEKGCITVAFETLGCKLNQAETELMSRQLVEAGCRVVASPEEADIFILNTCTVTHVADRKSRHLLRQVRRLNPGAKIVALGCYADSSADELAALGGVDLFAGNQSKTDLIGLLESRGYLASSEKKAETGKSGRIRSFIKAQDGCNNFCSYCIVPLVRGREKSLLPEQVIGEVRQRVKEGYQEVVLTGTEIGRYRSGSLDLRGLLERILAETGIRRLRLSSLQPQEIAPELLRLWQDPRLCRHFHLALQSGSDAVLCLMKRRYNTEQYAGAVSLIRTAVPGAAVTTDILVGFPGETGVEFQESYDFCRRMEFSRMHVFPFSVRKGTLAAEMPDHVEAAVKKQRSLKMLALARESLRSYHRLFIDRKADVLFESVSGGCWSGYTDTYIKVYAKSTEPLANLIVPVRLIGPAGDGLRAEIVKFNS